jgi:hypothetical protein
MTVLPEPPAAPAAGQTTPTDADRERIRRLFAALDEIEAEKPTAVRVDDPTIPSHKDGPRIGTAPPVAQPGIPPQSSGAVDYAVRVLATGVAGTLLSGGAALILAASPAADPVVCGIVFGAPMSLAVPIAALSGLAKRTKEVAQAAPTEIHQTYTGPVHQQHTETHTSSRSIWNKNTNQ